MAIRYLSLAYSRYARQQWQADPNIEHVLQYALQSAWTKESMLRSYQSFSEQIGVLAALRKLRRYVLLSLMERDLQQLANVEEIMQSMTWLAELSIQQALEFLYQELTVRYGVPRGQDSGLAQMLWVIGMGKLGGKELNVSSDIDLIYLYEEEGMTDGSQQHLAISNQEFFDCLAKALTQALSEINEYGFVFRVDLRLRPNGAAGFLACSLPMLQAYFATQARAWERFAWVKARLLGEPAKLVAKQARFTNIVHTFVYRPYWDLKILATLQDMSSQIHAAALRAQQRGQIDIKLLPGGIRDIECLASIRIAGDDN